MALVEPRRVQRVRPSPAAAPGPWLRQAKLLDVAREAAFAAGRRVMEVLRSTVETARKADHSLVTNADHEANTLILEALRRSFPEHGILSEETGREGPASSEYVWVVDPLDGTRAFVRGLAGFSVHVGLLKEGRPHAGVVFDPVAQTCFEAQRGQGAFLVGPGPAGFLCGSRNGRIGWPCPS
jgi:myo-inositol-1(or 4)-monophosphatase